MDTAKNPANAIAFLDGVDPTVTFASNILDVLTMELVLKPGTVSVKMKLMIIIVQSKICQGTMIVTRAHTCLKVVIITTQVSQNRSLTRFIDCLL